MTYLVDTSVEFVDDLCASVVSSCRLPLSQNTFTNQALVGFMNEEQQIKVTAILKKIREDYWLANFDQPILPNVYSYPMPARCTAGSLRNVVFLDPAGFEIDCPHLDPDQIKTPSYFAFRPSWQGQGFFLQDDRVVLWPQTFSNVQYKLRQKFERRPNQLTLQANCAKITAVNVGTQQITITFSTAPPFFANGGILDVISTTGQFSSQGDGLLVSAIGGSVMTIDPTTPFTSAVTVGSYVCPVGLTCIPQVPSEGYPLYVARGVQRVAMALSNSSLFGVVSKMAEDAIAELTQMLTPRVSGSPKKFVNKNTIGGPYSFPYYR